MRSSSSSSSSSSSTATQPQLAWGLEVEVGDMQVGAAGPLPAARLLRLHLRQLCKDAVHDVGQRLGLLPTRAGAAAGCSSRSGRAPRSGCRACVLPHSTHTRAASPAAAGRAAAMPAAPAGLPGAAVLSPAAEARSAAAAVAMAALGLCRCCRRRPACQDSYSWWFRIRGGLQTHQAGRHHQTHPPAALLGAGLLLPQSAWGAAAGNPAL